MRVCVLKTQGAVLGFDSSGVLIVPPPRGLVVVTGENGAGKSSLIELVSLAGWGRTLRGTPPIREQALDARSWDHSIEVVPKVEAHLGAVVVSRSLSPKRLEWTPLAGVTEAGDALLTARALHPAAEFENMTKAQAGLERLIGSWDVWRRSCVFSAEDSARFTLATDRERKTYLESVLGLERFDRASQLTRGDLRALERVADEAQAACAQAVLEVEMRWAEMKRLEATAPPRPIDAAAPPSAEEEARLAAGWAALERWAKAEDRATSDKIREVARARERMVQADQRRRRIEAIDAVCPTCEQQLPPEAHVALSRSALEELDQERRAVEDAESVHAGFPVDRSAVSRALGDRQIVLDRQGRAARVAIEVARERATWTAKHELAMSAARTAVAEGEQRLAAARERAEELRRQLRVLCEVDEVLGLRGVRAAVLGRALGGVEAVANAWLPRLGMPGLELKLEPTRSLKGGGEADTIDLLVEGAGGGHGYRACSQGQRRRIDLALLFGLGEVSAGAAGSSGSTLWFDEVFDALDASGTDALIEALTELSEDRCCVVITHRTDLAARLPAAMRTHVEQGRLHVGGPQ